MKILAGIGVGQSDISIKIWQQGTTCTTYYKIHEHTTHSTHSWLNWDQLSVSFLRQLTSILRVWTCAKSFTSPRIPTANVPAPMTKDEPDSKWFQVIPSDSKSTECNSLVFLWIFILHGAEQQNNSSCCSAPQWFAEASIQICLYVAVTFSFQNVLALLRACMSCLKHILESKQQEVQSTKDFEIAELLCIVYKSAVYPVVALTNPCIESASGAKPSRPRQVMAISHGSLALLAVAGPGFRSIRSWSLPMQTRPRDVRHFRIFTRSEMPWSQTFFFCLEGFDGLMDWWKKWKNTSSNWFGLSSMHAACQVCTCMSVEFLDCLAWTQGYFGYFKDERHPVSKET